MKNVFVLPISLFFLLGCSKDDSSLGPASSSLDSIEVDIFSVFFQKYAPLDSYSVYTITNYGSTKLRSLPQIYLDTSPAPSYWWNFFVAHPTEPKQFSIYRTLVSRMACIPDSGGKLYKGDLAALADSIFLDTSNTLFTRSSGPFVSYCKEFRFGSDRFPIKENVTSYLSGQDWDERVFFTPTYVDGRGFGLLADFIYPEYNSNRFIINNGLGSIKIYFED